MHFQFKNGDPQSDAVLELLGHYAKDATCRDQELVVSDLGSYLERNGQGTPWEGQVVVRVKHSTMLVAPDGQVLHL